ncbi:MAG: PQQ-binding-like beta-propeller repeat protein [Firmicutes bacterium]|nr:PQQ-binding-like beta-propeller repeat protein [Candidatus Fermentithermobacillaceae bacterium]
MQQILAQAWRDWRTRGSPRKKGALVREILVQLRKTASRIRFVVIALVLAFLACQTLPSYARSWPYQDFPFRPHPSLGYLPGGLVPKPFRFIVATDSHFGSAAGNKQSALAFQAIKERHGNAAFLVHMGDITETGASSEYDIYDALVLSLPFPVLNTLGNHESRWQDRYGQIFRDRYGCSSYSFDYANWHFVVLDTSYPGQTYGTIDPATLAWLERDLGALPPDRPIAIFAHHPLLYEARKFQDADDALLRILERYPVQVLFCGHGHMFTNWKAQGRDVFMIGALMDGAYAVVEVTGDEMRVYSEKVKQLNPDDFANQRSPDEMKTYCTEPGGTRGGSRSYLPDASGAAFGAAGGTSVANKPPGGFGPGRPDAPVGSGATCVERALLGVVTVRSLNELRSPITSMDVSVLDQGTTLSVTLELSQRVSLYYQIDGGPFVGLGDADAGTYRTNLDISGHAKGVHTLRVKAYASSGEGPYYAAREFGKLERDLVLWRVDLGSAVTGTPLWVSPQRIVVGTRDGRVLMIDIRTGEKVWEHNAGSSWCGGTIDGRSLYFTTSAGELVCLDVTDGAFWWKAGLDKSGFSSGPTVVSTRAGKAVIAGAASGKLYAVSPIAALLLWSFQAGGAITGGISAAEDLVFFGTWGTGVYAVEPGTGLGVWSLPLGRQIYYSPALKPLALGDAVYTTVPLDKLSGGSFIYALSVSEGLELWKQAFSESLLEPTVPFSSFHIKEFFATGSAPRAGSAHATIARSVPEVIVPGSGGVISCLDSKSGQLLWQLQGDGTLFSTVANLDSIYVTGGARGLINIFVNDVKIDYKVRDSFLFETPLVVVIPVGSLQAMGGGPRNGGNPEAGSVGARPAKGTLAPGFYAVIAGDTRGTLWAIAVPEVR